MTAAHVHHDRYVAMSCAKASIGALLALSLFVAPSADGESRSAPAIESETVIPQSAVKAAVTLPENPTFDVASIHQHIPEPHEHNSIWSSSSDSHFKAENVSLIGLIHWAFEIPETGIVDAPGWAGSTYFNIAASSDPSTDEKLAHLTSDAGRLQKEMMVRALLADRFKLVTHFETRQLPVYELVVAKGVPNLGEAKLDGTWISHGRDHLEVQGGNSTTLLAEELAKEVGRPVIDKTGVQGRYDLKIRWTPDGVTSAGTSAADAPPTIFTAIEEQLGLKLKPGKGPVQVLVIDHAEMPSEN
jgi:uncharacterized protein (TIGR03435 family)